MGSPLEDAEQHAAEALADGARYAGGEWKGDAGHGDLRAVYSALVAIAYHLQALVILAKPGPPH